MNVKFFMILTEEWMHGISMYLKTQSKKTKKYDGFVLTFH
ncbi:MAG: hypothetical protein CNLJKLNK_01180 [Holosporales bacterium]